MVLKEYPVSGSLAIQPTTVRWRLEPAAPFRVEDGILAAHGLRGRILGTKKENTDLREQGSGVEVLAGYRDALGDGPQHRHPHWLWLPKLDAGGEPTGQVEDLVLSKSKTRWTLHWFYKQN